MGHLSSYVPYRCRAQMQRCPLFINFLQVTFAISASFVGRLLCHRQTFLFGLISFCEIYKIYRDVPPLLAPRLKKYNLLHIFKILKRLRMFLAWFVALRPSQQLCSCRDGHPPNHTFFLGKLEQAVNQYFVHILSLVANSNPS